MERQGLTLAWLHEPQMSSYGRNGASKDNAHDYEEGIGRRCAFVPKGTRAMIPKKGQIGCSEEANSQPQGSFPSTYPIPAGSEFGSASPEG